MKLAAFAAIAGALAANAAAGQPHVQPYSGLQERLVKALSDEQVAELRAGRGMGLALAAELNGYPGPVHVLELADQLHLSDAQRAAMRSLYETMRAESIPIGERLITQESELDRQFASRVVTPESLTSAAGAIAATQGALRAAHLKYHLSTLEVLSPDQTRRYVELRGYAGAGRHGPSGHHPHPRTAP